MLTEEHFLAQLHIIWKCGTQLKKQDSLQRNTKVTKKKWFLSTTHRKLLIHQPACVGEGRDEALMQFFPKTSACLFVKSDSNI